jgi:starch phosphorylase
VTIGGRTVAVRTWRRSIRGIDGAVVPVLFLDTDIDENAPEDRALTHFLYGGDAAYRLAQETVLGIGGVRMLRALGYAPIRRFHMNEGHSALLVIELVSERLHSTGRTAATDDDVEAVRRMCLPPTRRCPQLTTSTRWIWRNASSGQRRCHS